MSEVCKSCYGSGRVQPWPGSNGLVDCKTCAPAVPEVSQTDEEWVKERYPHAVSFRFYDHWVVMKRSIDARHFTNGAQSQEEAWRDARRRIESESQPHPSVTGEGTLHKFEQCSSPNCKTIGLEHCKWSWCGAPKEHPDHIKEANWTGLEGRIRLAEEKIDQYLQGQGPDKIRLGVALSQLRLALNEIEKGDYKIIEREP